MIAANSEADAVNDNPATTQNRRHRHPPSGYISRQRECDDRFAQSGDLSHCGSRSTLARARLSRLKVPQVEPYIFASHQRHDLRDVVAARAEEMLEMYCLTGRDLRLRPAARLLGKSLYEGFSTRQRNIGKCVYKRSPEHSHEDIP